MQPNNLAKEVRKLLRARTALAEADADLPPVTNAPLHRGRRSGNLCPACKEEDIAAIVALTGGELVPARQETAFINVPVARPGSPD